MTDEVRAILNVVYPALIAVIFLVTAYSAWESHRAIDMAGASQSGRLLSVSEVGLAFAWLCFLLAVTPSVPFDPIERTVMIMLGTIVKIVFQSVRILGWVEYRRTLIRMGRRRGQK